MIKCSINVESPTRGRNSPFVCFDSDSLSEEVGRKREGVRDGMIEFS